MEVILDSVKSYIEDWNGLMIESGWVDILV